MNKVAFFVFIAVCSLGYVSGKEASGQEPARAFLDALRENGYHDVALDYLAELEAGDLITDDFRSGLAFEKAETLIATASRLRDYDLRERRLDDAQKLLSEHASQNKSLEVTARTLRFQGNLLYQRANIYLRQSESDRLTAAEKGEFYEKSRTMLEASLEAFRNAKSQITRLVDPKSSDAILIDPEDPSTRKRLQRFRKTYTDVTVQIPMVIEQLADTYEAADAKQKLLLEDAANEYKRIWDAYHLNPRGFPAGVQACIYSARCQQKLGNHELALNLLVEVFDMGILNQSSPLSQTAFILATDSWQQIKPYPHNEIVNRLGPIVKTLNRVETREPNWLRLQLELAVAKYAQAAEIKSGAGARATVDGKKLERAAARGLRNVARVPSPYRDRARELLSSWNVPVNDVADDAQKAPETFDDARQQGRDQVVELESLFNETSVVRKRLAASSDAAQQAELSGQLESLAANVNDVAAKSLASLELAIEMIDESTQRRDINDVRFLQCFCYFATQQYYESALIGEFLLSKYPTIDGTRSAMSMMIQSYSILLDRANGGDNSFERQDLAEACSLVVDRWPGSNEAGLAASTMTRLMLGEGDFEKAEEYFLKIPKDSVYRADLGIRVGRRLWFDYRKKQTESGADSESLAKQLASAKEYLKLGVDGASLDNLTYDTATSALLLVSAHLESGELEEAIARLEGDPAAGGKIAPLDLLKRKHAAVTKTANAAIFSRETYKTAIKVYLAAMKEGGDRQHWVDQANGVIAAMRQQMGASQDPKDRARVTAIYRLIAQELDANLETITDQEERKKFSKILASFLGSIENDSSDAKTVLWAGATLLKVADSLAKSGLDKDAKPLFEQAVSALNRAESIGFKGDPREAKMNIELKRQRALALRGSADFDGANEQFLQILTQSPNALNIQIDAAENLQMRAKATQRQLGYRDAIKGASPELDPETKRKKKQIWGWEKILRATRRNPKFRDTYYLSLTRIVECRMEYGVLGNDKGAIESAGREIVNERKRDSEFGGSKIWKSKFEALEKRVKAALK